MNEIRRAWMGPEPERGAHSSIVGELEFTPYGVVVPSEAMYNFVDLDDYPTERWPLGDWFEWSQEEYKSSLIPWHRIHAVGLLPEGTTVEQVTDRSWKAAKP